MEPVDSSDGACDFVLMGTSGFIGSKMLAAFEAAGFNLRVVPSEIRLQHRTELRQFIDGSLPRFGVVCCSGTRGKIARSSLAASVDAILSGIADYLDVHVTRQSEH